MPDLFGNSTQGSTEGETAPETAPDPGPTPDPNPPGITEGDVVEIPHKSTSRKRRTGFARKVDGANAWVDSDTETATGWYSLVALKPTTNP